MSTKRSLSRAFSELAEVVTNGTRLLLVREALKTAEAIAPHDVAAACRRLIAVGYTLNEASRYVYAFLRAKRETTTRRT